MEGIKYTRVEYSKTYNLGNYENERIGLTAEVPEGTDMLSAFNTIRNDVEAAHEYRKDLKKIEWAKEILKNKDNHYGREVNKAEEIIEEFYEKYPFHRPNDVQAALQLDEAPLIEHKDAKETWEERY